MISQSWFLTGGLKKLIERETETHKRSQKIQDLKEGLAKIKFFFPCSAISAQKWLLTWLKHCMAGCVCCLAIIFSGKCFFRVSVI